MCSGSWMFVMHSVKRMGSVVCDLVELLCSPVANVVCKRTRT